MALFVLCYIGLGISFYPYIVPPSVTIWEAAAPDNSLRFLLVGASVLMPIILAYTAYAYWVFRGKVDPHERLSLMRPWLRRLVWFVILWAGGVGVVGVLAYALRHILDPNVTSAVIASRASAARVPPCASFSPTTTASMPPACTRCARSQASCRKTSGWSRRRPISPARAIRCRSTSRCACAR